MKIGLISDTHGNIGYLKETVKKMIGDYGVDTLVFLGDECGDIETVKGSFKDIVLVHGVYCKHYKNKAIPRRLIKKFSGVRVLLTHTPKSHQNDLPGEDIKPENITLKDSDMVFYGHTHIPNIEEKDGVIWVNPGHLKLNDNRGASPSFGVIDFEKKEIKIIDYLNNKEIFKKDF
ncbi:MAG: YfcE family phosphodiesterase [Elusimicrobia bacterium]|nr:YfcE family phosphodiesterase [Elusimicrobiota bacterium]